MDVAPASRETCAVGRYHHNVYTNANTPRYVVFFDLQWQIIEYQRLEPATDLRSAMNATIERLASEGWEFGKTAKFGFFFLNRNGIRRLLILTGRDPRDNRPQSFSPFK